MAEKASAQGMFLHINASFRAFSVVVLPRFVRACPTAAPGRGRQLQTFGVVSPGSRMFIICMYGNAVGALPEARQHPR